MDVLTPWFSARVNPARKGAYLARFDGTTRYGELLWFDGRKWWWKDIEIRHRAFHWAGLAFDPARAVECSDAETGEPGMWVPTR